MSGFSWAVTWALWSGGWVAGVAVAWVVIRRRRRRPDPSDGERLEHPAPVGGSGGGERPLSEGEVEPPP